MSETTPTRGEAVPTGWRYSINYGPDGEENFANVYAADGQFVGNLRTHHAIAICNAFAVCEKPVSSSVDLENAFYMLRCRMLTTTLKEGEPVIHVFDRCVEAELRGRGGKASPGELRVGRGGVS